MFRQIEKTSQYLSFCHLFTWFIKIFLKQFFFMSETLNRWSWFYTFPLLYLFNILDNIPGRTLAQTSKGSATGSQNRSNSRGRISKVEKKILNSSKFLCFTNFQANHLLLFFQRNNKMTKTISFSVRFVASVYRLLSLVER